jgi:hypothetical protein
MSFHDTRIDRGFNSKFRSMVNNLIIKIKCIILPSDQARMYNYLHNTYIIGG